MEKIKLFYISIFVIILFSFSCWAKEGKTLNLTFNDKVPSFLHIYFNRPPKSSNGMEEALINLIDSAQKYVYAHFYQVNRIPVIKAFVRAAKRLGSENIKFITDDHYFYSKKYKKYYKLLLDAGIKIVTDRESKTKGKGQSHNKFCIVDDRYVWTGSYNITNNGTLKNNNNALLIDNPSIAKAYKIEFLEMYQQHLFGKYKKDNTPHHFKINGTEIEVYMAPTDKVTKEIIEEIKHADYSIYFVMFAFTSTPIIEAMKERLKNGVKIEGYLDNLQAKSRYSIVKKMEDLPVLIKWDKSRAMVHDKFMVIDPFTDSDPVVITGSFNFTKGAEKKNDENIVIIHNPAVASAYYLEFLRLFSGKTSLPPTSRTKLKLISCDEKEINLKVVDDGYGGRGVDLSSLVLADPFPMVVVPPSFSARTGDEIRVFPLKKGEKRCLPPQSKKNSSAIHFLFYPFNPNNKINFQQFTYELNFLGK